MGPLTIESTCGRYRMTVAPGDDGAAVTLWQYVGRVDGRRGGAVWRQLDHAVYPVPLHVALDRAHDLINGIADA